MPCSSVKTGDLNKDYAVLPAAAAKKTTAGGRPEGKVGSQEVASRQKKMCAWG
jgi:hypothetical protein